MPTMVLVELVCSDPECAVVVETPGDLAMLELELCDGCDCLMQVVAVDEAEDMAFAPVLLLAAA